MVVSLLIWPADSMNACDVKVNIICMRIDNAHEVYLVFLSGAKRETSVMRRIESSASGRFYRWSTRGGQGHSCFSLECLMHMS